MARKMKDSDVEWIGQIPEEWEVRKLDSIAELITDYVASGSFASLNENVKYLDEPDYAMLVRTVDLSGTQNKKPVYINKHAYEFLSNSNLHGGEIILSNIGSVGNVYFYSPLYERATLAPNAIMVNMKENNKFYYYWFLNPMVNEALKQIGSNAVQAKFNKTQLRAFLVVHPPEEEQQKIADFLDEKVGEIDKVIETTKATIEDYKKYKNAIIFEAVTKGICEGVELKESNIEWVGKVPAHWQINMLSQIFSQLKNKNKDLAITNLLSLSYGKIKRKDINSPDGLLPKSFDNYNIIDKNDIVLRLTDLQNDHKSLRVGRATEEGIITSAYVTLRCNKKQNTQYYYYYLHAFDICKGFYGMGSGVRQGLNFDELKKLLILNPPLEEQEEIANYLDEKCTEIDNLISVKERLIADMESYKKSLIYEYVTGKKTI